MVKKVQPPNGPDSWVFDTKVVCSDCGGVYQSEPGDHALKIRRNLGEADSDCPYCGWSNRIYTGDRSARRRSEVVP